MSAFDQYLRGGRAGDKEYQIDRLLWFEGINGATTTRDYQVSFFSSRCFYRAIISVEHCPIYECFSIQFESVN